MTGTYGPVLNTHAVCCEDYYFPEVKLKLLIVCVTRRTEGWGGGGGGVGGKNVRYFSPRLWFFSSIFHVCDM